MLSQIKPQAPLCGSFSRRRFRARPWTFPQTRRRLRQIHPRQVSEPSPARCGARGDWLRIARSGGARVVPVPPAVTLAPGGFSKPSLGASRLGFPRNLRVSPPGGKTSGGLAIRVFRCGAAGADHLTRLRAALRGRVLRCLPLVVPFRQFL